MAAIACIGTLVLSLRPPVGVTRRAAVPFGDPLELHRWRPALAPKPVLSGDASDNSPRHATLPRLMSTAAVAAAAPFPASAMSDLDMYAAASLDPKNFQPVCPASDAFYRFGQTLVVSTVGPESYKEYAPLIAGGLLRVRLELCVVESFFYEAIFPFIKENGVSWILPFHETVETFLAGVIFSVASNFILIGSTKIFSVIVIYADLFVGVPLRTVGYAGWRRLEDKAIGEKKERIAAALAAAPELLEKDRPWWKGAKKREVPPLDEIWEANAKTTGGKVELFAWGGLYGSGQACAGVRKLVEAADVFVGRYLLLTTVAYVAVKFVHFKIFPDFPAGVPGLPAIALPALTLPPSL